MVVCVFNCQLVTWDAAADMVSLVKNARRETCAHQTHAKTVVNACQMVTVSNATADQVLLAICVKHVMHAHQTHA